MEGKSAASSNYGIIKLRLQLNQLCL